MFNLACIKDILYKNRNYGILTCRTWILDNENTIYPYMGMANSNMVVRFIKETNGTNNVECWI